MKQIWAPFLVFSLGFLSPGTVWAFADRVDAPVSEVYEAARACFPEGVADENPQKKSVVTKWIQTTIYKTRRHAFVSIKTKERVMLRSRMKIELEEEPAYTYVSMTGQFEEKPTGAPPQVSWTKSVSTKELYFKEREAFFKLLACVEEQKKSASMQPPPAQPSAS